MSRSSSKQYIQQASVEAHARSSRHRADIEASYKCGCFYCLRRYSPGKITEWCDWPPDTPDELKLESNGLTAICPYCGVDAVIGSASGFPIKRSLLRAMKHYWFW